METDNLTHITSILIIRHGARAPSKPALQAFGTNAKIKESWTLPNGELLIDQLTDNGKLQCQILGEWARKYLQNTFSKFNSLDNDKNIKWRSSRIKRVVASGDLFWDGFLTKEEKEKIKIQNIPYDKTDDSDDIPPADYFFRTWDVHNEYKNWANNLLKSPLFGKKATEANDKLNSIVSTLGLKQFEVYPKPAVLYGMTFAREMVDCERYYNKISEKPLEILLSNADFEAIDELSLWCWDNRFFKHDYIELLSKNILGEIFSDIEHASDNNSCFSVYTGHDYTILVILAGLGVSSYEELLSFAAYLLIDVYDKKNENTGKTERVFTVSLNSTPFEIEKKATNTIQEQLQKSIKHPKTNEIYWSFPHTC